MNRTALLRRQWRTGFTLIELMTTVAIIGILAGLLIAALSHAKNVSNRNKTQATLKVIATALEAYKKDYGSYPIPATPSGAMIEIGGISWEGMGSKVLYQALSGDGDDAIEGGSSTSKGRAKSAPDTRLYWDGSDAEANVSRAVYKDGEAYYLVDGWGIPWQYEIVNPRDAGQQDNKTRFHNPGKYDLWSYGGNKEDFQNFRKWIKNW